MQKKYKFNNDRFKLRKEFFGGLLYEPSSGRMKELNKTAFIILNICKKPKTKEEIINELNRIFESGENFNKISKETTSFLNKLIEKDALRLIY